MTYNTFAAYLRLCLIGSPAFCQPVDEAGCVGMLRRGCLADGAVLAQACAPVAKPYLRNGTCCILDRTCGLQARQAGTCSVIGLHFGMKCNNQGPYWASQTRYRALHMILCFWVRFVLAYIPSPVTVPAIPKGMRGHPCPLSKKKRSHWSNCNIRHVTWHLHPIEGTKPVH